MTDSQQIEHENRPYAFEPYDEAWPQQYETIALEIRTILGDEVVRIEHVGSTSVPGLPAKPQIDVMVIARDFAAVRDYYGRMEAAGYTPRGDYIQNGEEYFTKDASDGSRLASIHVLPEGHTWATDLIDFRDYLRSHPDEVALYANAKRQAHGDFPNDYTNYYKAKLATVHELRQRAAAWRGHAFRAPAAE